MKVYRVLWLAVCVPLAVGGMWVAYVLSPAALAFLFIAFALVGAMLTVCVVRQDGTRPTRDRLRLVVSNALVGGSMAGGFAGCAVLLGAGVFLMVVIILAGSPYAVRTYRRWRSSAPTPSAAQADALPGAFDCASPEFLPFQPPSELSELTDEQLCQGWRASYMALQQQSPATQMIETVAQRQRYLDEFERRNASGFAAWLGSGARAPGNPLPYLTGGWVDPPTINWDELTRGQGC